MCFETTKSARAKIADKDIECWKFLLRDKKSFLAPYRRAKYKKRIRMPEVKIEKKTSRYIRNEYEIYNGYHSYKTESIAKREWMNHNNIFKCIIPKGTRYYSNRTEYVSETIILQ